MALGIQFDGPHKSCVVPVEKALELAHELRKLDETAYPEAGMMATWLETAADGTSKVTDDLLPGQVTALDGALARMSLGDKLSGPLACLWEELRTDSAG